MSEIKLLKNATILDVEMGELIEGMSIVIEKDRIVEVEKNINLQKIDQIIDLNGKIALPGLCDAGAGPADWPAQRVLDYL